MYMNVRLFAFIVLHQANHQVVLHKLINHECGEVLLSKKISPYAVRFGKLRPGSCQFQGYDVYARKEMVKMGPFGSVSVDIYSRASPEAEACE